MKAEIGAFEAKTHLSQLLNRVEAGETLTITRHGKRVARLVPPDAEPSRKAEFGCAKGKPGEFYMAPDFDEPLKDFHPYMS